MIYDSKETFMDIEGKIFVKDENEKAVKTYVLDYNGLEEGKRYLALPEGIEEVTETAFSEYNNGEVVLFIQNLLVDPAKAREDWQRKLRGQRAIKITFPKEASKSWFDKAEYMRKKELRVRFLKLYLPSTVKKIEPLGLPVLLEEIVVSEENPCFFSKDGVLYSKDRKRLIRFPGFRDSKPDYTIPENVEIIESFAFKDACLETLTIPDTVKEIRTNAFDDCILDRLVLPDSMETIPSGLFINCDIRRIDMPKELKKIESYAFRGTAGISEITTKGTSPEFGDGIFADGHFRSIGWWPWKVIPKACFLNAYIKTIDVPHGVEKIEDYAFAGCYQAKKIILPESVEKIEPYSFDEGETYSADITVPDHLLKYTYRFPALSKINKMRKHVAWQNRTDREFQEHREVLQKQIKAMQKYIDEITILQAIQKVNYKQEILSIQQLESHITDEENVSQQEKNGKGRK